MDIDCHADLVNFDVRYWNHVEQRWSSPESSSVRQKLQTAEHFRSKFEAMERSFRDEFISKKVTEQDGTEVPITKSADQRRGDTVLQLSNLLGVYSELIAVRRLNIDLRRRCVFLENVQTLLKQQNAMLMDVVVRGPAGRVAADERRPGGGGNGGFRGEGGCSPSPKPKRRAPEKQQSTVAATADAAARSTGKHRALRYQGSGGFDGGSSGGSPPDTPAPGKLHHRSMSVGSIPDIDLDVTSGAARLTSGADDPTSADRRDRKRSRKLQEKWQQVKKVFTAKLDVAVAATGGASGGGGGGTSGPSTGTRTKPGTTDKLTKTGSKKARSASTTAAAVAGPSQLHLLTVQQSGHQSRSVSPRTPSTADGADSSSCRLPSFTGSSSPGYDITDKALAEGEDEWRDETASAGCKSPLESTQQQQQLLTVVTTSSAIGRSSSFNMPKPTTTSSPDSVGSKSLPTTPVERAVVQSSDTDVPSTATSSQKARTAWDKVKGMVTTTTRRASSDVPPMGRGIPVRRNSSPDRYPTSAAGDDDESDPWVKKRPSDGHGTTSGSSGGRRGRSSVSPPGSTERQQRHKRFSVSHGTSTSGAGAALSNSPLDLAGLLAAGVSDDFTKKMEEWENRKKKSICKGESLDAAAPTQFTEDFIRKMEEWEKKKFAADDSGPSSVYIPVQTPSVDDSAVQSTLSESFSRTVQDWERVRQSRGKSRSVSTGVSPAPQAATKRKPSTDDRSKSRERDKSRQRVEKELSKLAKKEQKLDDEMRRLATARTKLEAQLESSSASERGGGGGGSESRGSAADEDERLLAALDLLENVEDRGIAPSERQPRGRSKSSRLRRQSCMMPPSFQRATSVGEAGRTSKFDRKSISTPVHRPGTSSAGYATTTMAKNDGSESQPTLPSPTAEDAGRSLRRQLDEKCYVVSRLQSEVQQLVDRINAMETQHSIELERCRKELRLCSRWTKQDRQPSTTASSLDRLQQQLCAILRDADKLRVDVGKNLDRASMEDMGRGEGGDGIQADDDRRLVDVFSSGEQDSVLYTRSTVARLLYSIIRHHGISAQFNAVNGFVAERNALIETMQRHLLVQEITNRLLLAELDRLDVDLQYLGDLRTRRVIRRWKTYHGRDCHLDDGVLPERRADRHQWACPSSRLLRDAVHDALSQDINIEQTVVDGLLTSLQQTLRDTVSTETQVEQERKHDVQIQTTLSVPPNSAPTSPRSPGGSGPVLGGQWPPHQQHQQMLQMLLLQRQQHQQRAPGSARSFYAPPSPRSPTTTSAPPPGAAANGEKPRKGSAPEFPTDFGRTLCVAAASNSAFRPVLTTRVNDWSPSRRSQHEPRLPYFEVQDVTGDGGKRFFRPIADGVPTADNPPSTGDVFEDSTMAAARDGGRSVHRVPSTSRSSDLHIAGQSKDVPAGLGIDIVTMTVGERSQVVATTVASWTVEATPPPSAATSSRFQKTTSPAQSRSSGTKPRRAHRSKTAELRYQQQPAVTASTGSVTTSPANRRPDPARSGRDRKWTADDDEDDQLFSSEAGSVALSSESARSRTKSDSSMTHSLHSTASHRLVVGPPPVTAGSSLSLLAVDSAHRLQDAGGRRRSAGWALDRGPPDGHSSTGGGPRSLRTSPFRQSPSPLIVRKLKSAAELLRECNELNQQRRSRPASSISSTRSQIISTRPHKSYYVTGTLISQATNNTDTSVSPQDSKPEAYPQVVVCSATDANITLRKSKTAVALSSSAMLCPSSGADSSSTLTHCRSSSDLAQSDESEFRTAEMLVGTVEHVRSASTPRVDAVEPTNTVLSHTQTVATVRSSRSKFLDTNWFHMPKFFKTHK